MDGIKQLTITLIICLLFVSGCSRSPDALTPPEAASNVTDQTIYIANHGWHTGIIIEKSQIENIVPQLATRFQQYQYLEIGWGDLDFYQADKVTIWLTLSAALRPTKTAVHVVGFNAEPNIYFGSSELLKMQVSTKGYQNLTRFIGNSFAYSKTDEILPINKGIYGDSQFYQGAGEYHWLNTCNHWAAKALYSVGLNIKPGFKFTSGSVMRALAK